MRGYGRPGTEKIASLTYRQPAPLAQRNGREIRGRIGRPVSFFPFRVVIYDRMIRRLQHPLGGASPYSRPKSPLLGEHRSSSRPSHPWCDR